MSAALTKIQKAKAGLILDQPFFASILLSMPMILDNSQPTMATDGETIYFNETWVSALQLPEVTFVLAHETMHAVFQHMLRLDGKNLNKWNVATDHIINTLLVTEGVGVMPKGALCDFGLVKNGNGTAEGVYRLLPKETEQKPGGNPGGPNGQPGPLDTLLKPKGDEEEARREIEGKVRQAKNAGKMSANLKRFVKELLKTTTPWRDVLRRFVSEKAKVEYSYARPKRRFLAEDLYLPSLVGEQVGAIAVAVDCSGSIDEKLLALFEAEIKAIHQDVKPSRLDVLYFDSKVLPGRQSFGPDDTVKLNHVGGGGTAFSPVFQTLNADETQPVACIVLTDLYCSDFGPQPDYPVLWASITSRDKVPFGEVTYIKEVGK